MPSENASKKNKLNPAENKATLIIQQPVVDLNKASADHTYVNNGNAYSRSSKISSLEKIRQQVALDNKSNDVLKELNEEELYVAWGLYVEELRKKNNHSGVANFKSALLKIIDNNNLEIITENNIQQIFIEAERAELINHLQLYFSNRFLTYKVIMEKSDNNNASHERPLTTKEQYLKIIEEFPLVKQLKDKLGLQLDY